MTWRLERVPFVLIGFEGPPDADDLAVLAGEGPGQVIREGGETTLLVPAARAEAIVGRHPGARSEGPLAWIRFELAMDWELVGFLALVAGALAEAGVPIGAVCGFSRDHLFIADPHLPTALTVLEDLFGPPARDPD